ncbi:MAG: phosphatase PAP2 family protein [Ruminococcaceae bacterium]|nr:phosphatase PAP2 family protein [Oscillospiraceae bacterium]
MELAVLDWIQACVRTPFLDRVVPAFTQLSNHGEIWIAMAVLLMLWKKTRKAGLSVSCGLLLDLLTVNMLLKPLVGRVRPFAVNTAVQLLVEAPHDASFPSGHTGVSFAAVGALYASGSPLWKPASVLAALMALSRLYLYVHWPSDIIGGVIVGWLCGWLGAKLVKLAAEAIAKRKTN